LFVVDTNILVYAANRDSPDHKLCNEWLATWARQQPKWHVTWGICYEFMRVVTHEQVLRSPWSAVEAWDFLEALRDSGGLEVLTPTERHAVVLAQLVQELPHLSGNIMHDVETAVLMREHGIRRIYTRDTDFHKFAFLEPVDPTRVKG